MLENLFVNFVCVFYYFNIISVIYFIFNFSMSSSKPKRQKKTPLKIMSTDSEDGFSKKIHTTKYKKPGDRIRQIKRTLQEKSSHLNTNAQIISQNKSSSGTTHQPLNIFTSKRLYNPNFQAQEINIPNLVSSSQSTQILKKPSPSAQMSTITSISQVSQKSPESQMPLLQTSDQGMTPNS